MGQKNRYSEYTFESEVNGTGDYDPNFDLDQYIKERSNSGEHSHQIPAFTEEKEQSNFKNAILVFIVFAAAFLWLNDWSVSQAWNSVFGEETVTEVAVNAPEVDIPEINVPEPPAIPGTESSSGFVEYLTTVNELGLDEYFSNIALQSMYQSDVPVEYLEDLINSGYQDFSYPEVIGYYSGGVTIDYLDQLRDTDFLNSFSYPAIIGFYNSEVSMEYLSELRQAGFIENYSYPAIISFFNSGVTTEYLSNMRQFGLAESFSYPAIVSFYNSGVSIEYLDQLNGYGYLSDFSYSAIIGFYNSGVTVEFLNQLESNNLLEGMSYPDIISAFNADN